MKAIASIGIIQILTGTLITIKCLEEYNPINNALIYDYLNRIM